MISQISGFPTRVAAEDTRTGVERWSWVPRSDQRGPTLVVGDTTWNTDVGGLHAHDLRTGRELWNLDGPFTSDRTPLVAGQGTLLTRTYDDGLIGFTQPGPDTRISRRPGAHTSARIDLGIMVCAPMWRESPARCAQPDQHVAAAGQD